MITGRGLDYAARLRADSAEHAHLSHIQALSFGGLGSDGVRRRSQRAQQRKLLCEGEVDDDRPVVRARGVSHLVSDRDQVGAEQAVV